MKKEFCFFSRSDARESVQPRIVHKENINIFFMNDAGCLRTKFGAAKMGRENSVSSTKDKTENQTNLTKQTSI